MVVSTLAQQMVAVFWTLSSLAGLVVTLPMTLTAYVVWQRLKVEAVDHGMTVMTLSHVQADALRVAMHLSFFILGAARLLGPVPPPILVLDPLLYWFGVGALMLVPLELITVSLLALHARREASRDVVAS